MSQIRETKCLTPKQIEIIMNNWAKIFKFDSMTKLYNGKPVFSTENIKKWKLPHLTKFADNYTLYECKRSGHPNMYFITIETDKFDKVNIQACIWFYHFFEDIVYKTQKARPEVYICPAFVVTDAMFLHVPTNLVPCMYRFAPLPTVYPLIGSKNTLFSMTYDYTLLTDEDLNGTRKYSIILDNDPVIKILNALPGETIQYKRVLCEGSPYGEYYRRTVVSTVTDINIIAPSGICNGKSKAKTANDDENDGEEQ